ncbi:MAG: hypothetical protein U1A27_03835 [Phycisphaerae bacterium]
MLLAALSSLALVTRAWTQLSSQGSALSACQRNLFRIGQASAAVAQSDFRMILHPQSTGGVGAWRGLGAWDWGGADGACGEMRSDYYYGPEKSLGAKSRLYNPVLVGGATSPTADFGVYRCPMDVGSFDNPYYVPHYASPYPCPLGRDVFIIQHSMFDAMGNSYQGDFIWLSDSSSVAARLGTFMRPAWAIPRADETILFYEHRMAQAMLATAEFLNEYQSGNQPVPIPSWHGVPFRHNALMADGHVQEIEIRMSGSMLNPNPSPILSELGQEFYVIRGPGWRYDCSPEQFVFEQNYGNPIMSPPTRGGFQTHHEVMLREESPAGRAEGAEP